MQAELKLLQDEHDTKKRKERVCEFADFPAWQIPKEKSGEGPRGGDEIER